MSFRPLTAKMLVVVCAVMLGLIGAEASVRVLAPVPAADLLPLPRRYDDVGRMFTGTTYIRFDPDLGWSPRPGTRVNDDGVVYEANAAGFRSTREYDLQPSAGVTRVAVFGDSFTH